MRTELKHLKNLNNGDFKPLYFQLSEILAEYIKNNGLQPGDPIPSENHLIQRYGISRMTVRIAMQRLATEGIIKKVQGKGTFVAEPKFREYVKGVRPLEETFAEQGIRVSNTLLEYGTNYPTKLWLDDLNLPEGSQTFRVRRLKKIGDEVLALEIGIFLLQVAEKFAPEELATEPFINLLRLNQETEVHRVVYRTRFSHLLERDAETMGVPVGSSAIVRFGVHYNRMDNPLMTGRIVFPADKIELHFEARKDEINPERLALK